MLTFWQGDKPRHVTLLFIAYVTAGLVAAQEPVGVPTNNQDEGQKLVVSDLQAERRLDEDDFKVVIGQLSGPFDDLMMKLEPFSKDDSAGALNAEIPFIGKSINELVAGESVGTGIEKLLDFTSYVEDNDKARLLNLTELQSEINEFFNATTLNAEGNVMACVAGDDPIVFNDLVVFNGSAQEVTVTICAQLEIDRDADLDADGLFDALDGFAEIDLDLMLGVTATVSFGATFTVDLTGTGSISGEIELAPVVISLSGQANTSLTLALGMLDLASNATVSVSGFFELTFCEDPDAAQCEDDGIGAQLADSSFYLDRDVGYKISGTTGVSTSADVPGLSLPDGAEFEINELSVFNPAPDITFPGLSEISGIDLESFIDFSPQNGVALLTKIDSALVRAQENEAFDLNIPFSDLTFSRILATGSVVTSKLLEFFVRPEYFEDRESKSLDLTANENVISSGDTLPAGGKRLEFYFFAETGLGNELTANPEDQKGIRELSDVHICEFILETNATSDEDFSGLLIDGINTDGCGVKACEQNVDGCDADEKTGDISCTNTCDILIGVNDGGFVSIASVAYRSGEALDVQLFGLFEPLDTTNGPGSLYGFPLNQPTFPNLVPRFRNLAGEFLT